MLYGDMSEKVRLTALEGATVLGCVKELNRQPLFDKSGEYEYQKTYTCEYKNLKLKGTLDRTAKELIRDTKSCSNINNFIWEWKDQLQYDISMSFYWVLKYQATGEKSKLILDTVQKTFPFPSRIYEIPQGEVINTVNQIITPALDTLASMMTAWEETKDENIWKVKQPDFNKLASCDLYPIMESALQEEYELLQ